MGRIFVRSLIGVAGLVLVLIALFETPWGKERIKNYAENLVNRDLRGATVEIAQLSGNLFSSVLLHSITLRSDDNRMIAEIDTVEAVFWLPGLLKNQLLVRRFDVRGARIQLEQQSDSTWGIEHIRMEAAPDESSSRALQIRLSQAALVRAHVTARFFSVARDSVLNIDSIGFRVSDIQYPLPFSASIDSLWAHFTLPGVGTRPESDAAMSESDRSVYAGMSGSFVDGKLVLADLRFQSEKSTVTGRGEISFPLTGDDPERNSELSITALPLAFSDLRPFIPSLHPDGELRLNARVRQIYNDFEGSIQADFLEAGSVTIEAERSTSSDGSKRIRLDAEILQLSPGTLLDSVGSPPPVDGYATMDLTGPSFTQLSGALTMRLTALRVRDAQFSTTELHGQFASGTGDIAFSSSLNGAPVLLSGTIRPFIEKPTFELTGSVAHLDPGSFGSNSGVTGDVSTDFWVQGIGIKRQDSEWLATFLLRPSRVNRANINAGTTRFSVVGDSLSMDTDILLDTGNVAFSGYALLGSDVSFGIDSGRFSGIDLSAFSMDSTSSSVNGSFSLTGTGVDPVTMDLKGNISLDPSNYGSLDIERAGVEANLSGGQLGLNGDVNLAGNGRFSLVATANLDQDAFQIQLDKAEFQNINLGPVFERELIQTDLSGTATGAANGPALDQLNGRARLDLNPSTFNAYEITSASVGFDFTKGEFTAEAELESEFGAVSVTGSAAPFDEEPWLSLKRATFSGLNLGYILNLPNLTSDLSGSLALDVHGIPGKVSGTGTGASVDANFQLEKSTLNAEIIEEGSLIFSHSAQASSLESVFNLESGTVRLYAARLDSANAADPATPKYRVTGDLRGIDAAGLAGIDSLESSLSMTFELETTHRLSPFPEHRGRITITDSFVDAIRLDTVDVSYAWSEAGLDLESIRASGNVLELSGSRVQPGTLARTAAARTVIGGHILDTSPLRRFLGDHIVAMEDNSFVIVTTNADSVTTFELSLSALDLSYGELRLSSMNASTKIGVSGRSISSASGFADLGFLAAPRIGIESSRFDAAFNNSIVELAATIRLDATRSVFVEGMFDPKPDGPRIQLTDLDINLEPSLWSLSRDTDILLSNGFYVDNFVIQADSQSVTIDGELLGQNAEAARISISKVEIGPVATLFGYDTLEGTLSSTLRMSWIDRALNFSGNTELNIRSRGNDLGFLTASLDHSGTGTRLEAKLLPPQTSVISLSGFLPTSSPTNPENAAAQFQANSVSLAISADSSSIAWIQPFLDRQYIDRLRGTVSTRLRISGSLNEPSLAGFFDVNGASFFLPEYGESYSLQQLSSRLQGKRIVIEDAVLESGGGSVDVAGSIDFTTLKNSAFNLTATLDRFRAVNNEDYRATFSGDLELGGRTTAPILTGNIRTLNTDIHLSDAREDGLAVVSLTPDDERMLEQEFGYRITPADTTSLEIYKSLEFDLRIGVERDTWIRRRANPEMGIELSGVVEVKKDSGSEKLSLFRSIDVVPQRSFIKQFGRRFSIQNGEVQFNGPVTELVMNITASYDVISRLNPGEPEATITLALTGRLDDLQFTLGSDPAMENTDIISYLATGRPASQSFQLEGLGVDQNAVIGLAAGRLAGVLEGVAGQGLGLDVIEIQQDGLRGTQLTAGKYVSPRLYIGVSHPISFGGDSSIRGQRAKEITVEYAVFKMLLLQMVQDAAASTLRLNLTGRYTY